MEKKVKKKGGDEMVDEWMGEGYCEMKKKRKRKRDK